MRSNYSNNIKIVGAISVSFVLLASTLVSALLLIPSAGVIGAESSINSASDGVYSDFNGDGYGDLSVGVPGEDVGAVQGAGAVNVLYGSSSGLQTSSPADQFWHQNSPGVDETAENGDGFGTSLASGDFNNDDFFDLAIGVPGETIGTEVGAGAVHILYGSSSGLQTSSPADQFWHQNSPSVLNTAENGDGFGTSLASGDFNNDGFGDLSVGVPFEDIGAVSEAGAVHILYGSSSGLQATSLDDQFWHQGKPGVEDVEEGGDFFGKSLAAGDFNNDGFGDLSVGVPFEDIGAVSEAGAVHILYGSSSGLQTSSPAAQFWNEDSPGVDDIVEDGTELFGSSLAAGDFNNDGFGDLSVGVPAERTGKASAGAVHILYGSSSGLQTSSPAAQFWHQGKPGVEDVEELGDGFGTSLASGDFNNDGFGDLSVGVPLEDIGTISNAGAVNVLYGSSSGLQTSSPAAQFWHQNSPGVDDSRESEDRFGFPLAAGDFNNDGFGDLSVGVPLEDIGTISNAGAVNVLYGSSSGLQTSSPADQFWHQNSPGVDDSRESEDRFGFSLPQYN